MQNTESDLWGQGRELRAGSGAVMPANDTTLTTVASVGRRDGQNSQSPLRYPGGKSRAAKTILAFFPEKPGVLVSPFIGGGSVELAAVGLGWTVLGFDLFQPLVAFWQVLLTAPEELADEVQRYYPLPKQDFYRLQESKFDTQLEEAARYFVLNRCSFSGTTMSGGMSPGHDRFTPSSIERVRNFRADNLWVEQAEFSKSIMQNRNAFLYLDPPYFGATRLYGRRGDLHEGFYHQGLCRLLKARGNWLLSYDDCPEVREMYAGCRIVPLSWTYGMSANKASREIIILGHDW
jgi:DNA adenine methylase